MNNKEFWIWLAGFIDGDGCFCLNCSIPRGYTRKDGYTRKYIVFAPTVSIKLRDYDASTLDYIQQQSGCGRRYAANRDGHTPEAIWQTVTYREAIKICKGVLPYLIPKRQSCEVLLKAAKFIEENSRRRNGNWQKGGYQNLERIQKLRELREQINPNRSQNYKRLNLSDERIEDVLATQRF